MAQEAPFMPLHRHLLYNHPISGPIPRRRNELMWLLVMAMMIMMGSRWGEKSVVAGRPVLVHNL